MSTYYVRIQGRITGPFNQVHLQDMRAKGKLHKFHEISVDKTNWYSASEFVDLFPEDPTLRPKQIEAELSPEPVGNIASSDRPNDYRRLNQSLPILVTIGVLLVLASAAGI